MQSIDGFGRKIIWLKVGSTNNNPSVVHGNYFLKMLQKVPELVRSDRASENLKICGLQRFFRREHDDQNAGSKSVLYGTSTSNQRVESWWSIFRKGRMNFVDVKILMTGSVKVEYSPPERKVVCSNHSRVIPKT